MTSYWGNSITYDAIGSPLSWGDYGVLTWQGRRLESYTDSESEETFTYTYNSDGIRTSKTIDGVEHIYHLSGTQVLSEEWNEGTLQHLLIYIYDASGSPIGMAYRDSTYVSGDFDFYLFAKNIQGDILYIYNTSGTRLVTYTYDAWGKCYVTYQNGGASTAARYNPFRYRGYYYDTETGFYYLNSRYYDPEVGRFLNADGYINGNGDLIGYNMFAYCGNNPVIGYDPLGEWNWGKIAGGAFFAAIGALTVATVVLTGGSCLPLVALAYATVATAGTLLVGIGASEMIEGVTDTNPLREYMGEDTYETVKNASIAVAAMASAVVSIGSEISICFVEGTQIATGEGLVPIEDIQPGDLVLATDPDTGETALKPVVQTFRNETEEWIHVTVNGEEITCTPNHPFYSPVKGWTSAIDLKAGDILVMLNGGYVVVEQVQHELLESPETTYNFEVADFHTYYVGDTEVLVHNACGKEHGNSLSTSKSAQGYVLKENGTGRVLKFGETTLGKYRYSQNYLDKNNAYMDFVKKGTKAEMHTWQHNMIKNYFNRHGVLPPMNKSFW